MRKRWKMRLMARTHSRHHSKLFARIRSQRQRGIPQFCPHFCVNSSSLKYGSGGAPPGPVEREFIRTRENVCAVVTDTKWNIAHQCNSAFFSIKFDLTPLFMGYPLHIAEEILSIPQGCLSILRQIVQPVARSLNGLMFG